MFSHDVFHYFVFMTLNPSQAAVALIGRVLLVVRVEARGWAGAFEHQRKSYRLLDHSTR